LGGERGFLLVLQQVSVCVGVVHILRIKDKRIPHPASARCLRLHAYVPGTLNCSREDANGGLHHSRRLHQGGCNPILFAGAVVQPVRRPLPLSAECHPLSPSSVHSLCSVRLVGGAHASGIVASHCSPPTGRAPFKSARHGAASLRNTIHLY